MECYEGNQPYVFLSYAHKDSPAVLPIFEGLYKAGFRLWYDAGTEWPEYIAEHLERAEVCLCFLTQSFLDSSNCRQELNFALSEGITVPVIYVEEPKLSAGMKMRLCLTQAMFRGRFPTEAAFMESLCEVKLPEPCKNMAPSVGIPTETPAPAAPPTEAHSSANQAPTAMENFWNALLSEASPPANQAPKPTEPPKTATPPKPTPPPCSSQDRRTARGEESPAL